MCYSYARVLFVEFLRNASGYHECLHCGQGNLYDATCSDSKRRCGNDKCLEYTCATHDIPWHEKETCEDYNARISEYKDKNIIDNELSVQKIQEESKACPGCSKMIFRQGNNGDDGCEHMTCQYKITIRNHVWKADNEIRYQVSLRVLLRLCGQMGSDPNTRTWCWISPRSITYWSAGRLWRYATLV